MQIIANHCKSTSTTKYSEYLRIQNASRFDPGWSSPLSKRFNLIPQSDSTKVLRISICSHPLLTQFNIVQALGISWNNYTTMKQAHSPFQIAFFFIILRGWHLPPSPILILKQSEKLNKCNSHDQFIAYMWEMPEKKGGKRCQRMLYTTTLLAGTESYFCILLITFV